MPQPSSNIAIFQLRLGRSCTTDLPHQLFIVNGIFTNSDLDAALNLQLPSDMDGFELGSFVRKHHYKYLSHALKKVVDHISELAPHLAQGFGEDHYRTRYLRRAVMCSSWDLQSYSQMITTHYTIIKFLNHSMIASSCKRRSAE